MIDWLAILIALVITTTLVGFFGYLAWKINMSNSLTLDNNNQFLDSTNDKKNKKDKTTIEHSKKKRKDQKKSKRENKDDEQQRNKSKELTLQTSEETDDERDESEQELLKPSSQPIETSSKARKRNKNKSVTPTPPPTTTTTTTTRVEDKVKDEKNLNTTRAPPVTHPKSIAKDEVESTKQQSNVPIKSSEPSKKQIFPISSQAITKKPTQSIQEQPFTVVGGNRHKAGTPPLQQQQNKLPVSAVSAPAPPVQPSTSVQVQHDQLAQRQQVSQKEISTQLNGVSTNSLPLKQQQMPTKIADLIKVLPSSQVVVTELMSALDAFPLSTDELDIIMHKIANKQSVLRQDWNKLQHGQKVDPQAHIGQVMDKSAKAYEDEMKNNAMKHIKELTDELNAEKLRNNVLLKEKNDKEHDIQMLHVRLNSIQHKHESINAHPQQQQQQIQKLELQLQRVTEENIHLNQQLAQHQQQQLVTSNLIHTGDSSNLRLQVLSEQIKKLSVDNAHLEKKAKSNELLAHEAQKEREDLIRYNEQLTQSLQNVEKDLKHVEEKHHKKFNETQTLHMNDINEYKRRIEQLERDNEQLRREDIVHVEPTAVTDIQTIAINNEEREQLEKEIHQLKQILNLNQEKEREYNDLKQKLIEEIEEYKKKVDDLQIQYQFEENELRQEIERLKQNKNYEQQQTAESYNNELAAKNIEIGTLRTELNEVKSIISQSEERLRQEHERQRKILTDLLPSYIRNQLPHDNQDFDQWLSSYRQLFESSIESSKKILQEESAAVKLENDQLHKNMKDVESHLREIEKTVQYKEETLLTELKSKDATLESIRNENDQLNDELQRLRNEIQRLQSAYDTTVNEVSALKLQLDDRFLVAANTPPVDVDQSFELVKHPTTSLSTLVIDVRAKQLNELIRSGKEALEHQDSLTQQLDKHLNDLHLSGTGETSPSNADESTLVYIHLS
ncbi:unnamed protein product [Rotaria sordida]|uniref:Uncharacterized protein n=1 Tax=Rotaria sordida TaxID=392033 RepID=A0A813ZBI5_9BILA|nr:unnamed protein product [Rotaria sordida]